MSAVAISAGIVTQRVQALTIPTGCWSWEGAYDQSEFCRRLLNAFYDIRANEAGHVRLGLFALPTLVGLVLGSTLVGRELELRTAPLAWSLEGGRMRWLAQRLGGVVALLVLGLGAMALLGAGFDAALRLPSDSERLGELAMRGLPLLTRGLAALGIALLAGAVLGRTPPALLLATVAVGALWFVGSGVVPQAVGAPFATWMDDADRRAGAIAHVLGHGQFDTSRPGVAGEPGERLDWNDANQRGLPITCGSEPARGVVDPRYEACINNYDPSMTYGWWLAVPSSALPVVEGAQAGLDLVVGGGSIALTAFVVRRRRPD